MLTKRSLCYLKQNHLYTPVVIIPSMIKFAFAICTTSATLQLMAALTKQYSSHSGAMIRSIHSFESIKNYTQFSTH